MKRFVTPLIMLIVAGSLIALFTTRTSPHVDTPTPVAITPSSPNSPEGDYCYSRNQVATPDAPYKVEEHVVLHIDKETVTGTKSGTQAGPDMTNGFTGTLTGNIKDNEIQLIYDYRVEGSANKEQEHYTFSENTLIKHQYQLIQGKDILVPNINTFVRDIIYIKEVCK